MPPPLASPPPFPQPPPPSPVPLLEVETQGAPSPSTSGSSVNVGAIAGGVTAGVLGEQPPCAAWRYESFHPCSLGRGLVGTAICPAPTSEQLQRPASLACHAALAGGCLIVAAAARRRRRKKRAPPPPPPPGAGLRPQLGLAAPTALEAQDDEEALRQAGAHGEAVQQAGTAAEAAEPGEPASSAVFRSEPSVQGPAVHPD